MFEVYDGFFNSIPGDSTLVDLYNVAGGFDLVSSNWVDWKGFLLHQESNPDLCPRLQGKDGEIIQSKGYISGSWVQGDVKESWITAKIFVVDAVFAVDEKAQHSHNFLFSMDSAGARRKLSTIEKRFLLGDLNPTFFHHVGSNLMALTVWVKARVTKGNPPNTDNERLVEAQRRVDFDRAFEKIKKDPRQDEMEVKRARVWEMERRSEWEKKQKLKV